MATEQDPIDFMFLAHSPCPVAGPMANLHSKILDVRSLLRPTFLHFHVVFGKFWQNNSLASPFGLAPSKGNPEFAAGV